MSDDIHCTATGHWPDILEAAGIDKQYLSRKNTPCPACGGNDRFAFRDKEGSGSYFCRKCGGGDGFTLLQRVLGWSFAESAKFIRNFYGIHQETWEQRAKINFQQSAPTAEELEKIRQTLAKTWDIAQPIGGGDPVWRYLVKTRELPLKGFPPVLRFHRRFPYYGDDRKLVGHYPMMLAKVQGPDGRPVALHRTYLSKDGVKAPVEEPKKLMKTLGLHGAAVRLYKPGKRLVVCEGIETAFAAHFLTGLPAWSTLTASLMPEVFIPEDVEEVLVFADNDLPDTQGVRAGQQAAEKLAQRLEKEGKKVRVVIPVVSGSDFHDVWLSRLDQVHQRRAA